ncbi:putative gamma-glutamyltransferase [Dictyocaulus viviparus]|uniref:Putative gamma-glutamyltransferase n=1 Tax=Dictyocaulus viviparus TaxID=29172 RepID=A0A0D8Y6D0_DICVI|nr:putative gamma-glutamyltransferase [Dictyocaulus viviparus]
MFCLGVTNPQSSGLGGGFLMTIYNKTTGTCYAIDARETAPAAARREMFINNSNGSKYGRVAWKDLIIPSAQLCRDGVPVSEYLDSVMKVKERHFRAFPSMRYWINPFTNSTYKTGDLLPRLRLAKTLEAIANSDEPVELFYRGEMARTIAKEMAEGGGIITYEDLASYEPKIHHGMTHSDFRGNLVMCGGPPPSSFAVTQLIVSIMSELYPNGHRAKILNDPKVIHHFIEAMKFSYAQRTLLGDGAFVPSAISLASNLTTKGFTDWVVKRMKDVAQSSSYYGGIAQTQVPDHGTSQVSVLDEYGNGVSSTTTINRWFGAAVESEEYGIVWNDEMDDFSTPGMANGFGFAPSETNFIEPGKRPMSSMSPMVIFDGKTKKLKMVIGGSGGSKIISAVAKRLKSILEMKYGQVFRNTTGFEGIVQGIVVDNDGIRACGDFRRKTDQKPSGY